VSMIARMATAITYAPDIAAFGSCHLLSPS
jgi:hypothetical protein